MSSSEPIVHQENDSSTVKELSPDRCICGKCAQESYLKLIPSVAFYCKKTQVKNTVLKLVHLHYSDDAYTGKHKYTLSISFSIYESLPVSSDEPCQKGF